MAGVIFVLAVILLVRLNNGGFSTEFWVRAGKILAVVILLVVFEAGGITVGSWVAPFLILLVTPSLFLKYAVVPFGLPRFTYWMARCLGPVALLKESSAGAALYGALAFARRPGSAQTLDWLERRISRSPAVGGAGLTAAGLFAALRGDRLQARRLLLVADSLGQPFILSSMRVVARNWLVVDAAKAGRWHAVVRLGNRGKESMHWSHAMARIAQRLLGEPRAYPAWNLWLLWLIGGRWRVTLPLLRRALAVRPAPETTALPPSPCGELSIALAHLARGLPDGFAQDSRSLARPVGEIAAALDASATRAHVTQRLLALGARDDADAVLRRFRECLSDVVVPLIEASPALARGTAAAAAPPLLDQAIERARANLFKDAEAQCRDYADRLAQEVSLADLAEWTAWANLRETAERLLELAPWSEPTLFNVMFIPVCNFASFQHNRHKRIALANEMFSWLLLHAQGDAAAATLLFDNVRAGNAAA